MTKSDALAEGHELKVIETVKQLLITFGMGAARVQKTGEKDEEARLRNTSIWEGSRGFLRQVVAFTAANCPGQSGENERGGGTE